MNAARVAGPRYNPKKRRTRAEIFGDPRGAVETLAADYPVTVQQAFYQTVGIDKTGGKHKQTIVQLLNEMWLADRIPFSWVADNRRWRRKRRIYYSLRGMQRGTEEAYSCSGWDSQNSYVEIWLEKDALAGVLHGETEIWDVPLMVTRGYPSVSYLYQAAATIRNQGKPAFPYYFGDHDPIGRDITRATEAGLREFAPDAEIHFEQIRLLKLPTRPTKATDSRGKNFRGESVEVDAIPSSALRALVQQSIEQHVDAEPLERLRETERHEREALERILRTMESAA